ncbi:response regulator transcription factor [Streptomyces spongiae]|uniref:Response regulator transcription factor n=2 Tax=Streptomyces spongiae TaxID=565072 RepID=A0A5N8XVR2_9ACTN|nr:response regulator transcription factor [Streptomyces spongiae]
MRGATRVLVVDRHPLWRREIAAQLNAAGYEVVAGVDDGPTALREARASAPHVVVAGMDLPDASGARLCRELRDADVAARVLVFSASRRTEDVRQAVSAGAAGYLLKSSTREELIDGVRRTAAGERVFSSALEGMPAAGSVPGAAVPSADAVRDPTPPLSPRETQILALVGKGLSYRAIAARLNLSASTVQIHVQRMVDKLPLHSRQEFIRYAIERDLRGNPSLADRS